MATDIMTRPMKVRPKEMYGPTTGNSNSSLRRTASEGGIEPSSSNHKTGKRIVGTFLNRLKSQNNFTQRNVERSCGLLNIGIACKNISL
jgi:hypothetical protein